MLSSFTQHYESYTTPVVICDGELGFFSANGAAIDAFPGLSRTGNVEFLFLGHDMERITRTLAAGRDYIAQQSAFPLSSCAIHISPIIEPPDSLAGAVIFLMTDAVTPDLSEPCDNIVSAFFAQILEPLNYIFGSLSAVMRRIDDEKLYGYIKEINTNAYKIKRACSNNALYTRCINGVKTADIRRVDITEFLKSLCGGLALEIKRMGVEFVYELPEDPVYTLCDHGRIADAVLNIISNSIGALRHEGEDFIKLTCSVWQNTLMVTVSDNGVGIEPEKLALITRPYCVDSDYLGAGTDLPRSRSLGIGLAIAREVALMHGGTMTIQSNAGEGTSVAFTIELRDDPNSQPLTLKDTPNYTKDRFSPLYVILSDVCEPPLP